MRYLLPLCLLLVAAPVRASNPGEPLDCSDFVFEVPGLTCSIIISHYEGDKGSNLAIDNQGRQLTVFENFNTNVLIHSTTPGEASETIGTIKNPNIEGMSV